MNKKIKLLFILSLITNVVLLGVVGGHAIKRMQHDKFKEMRLEQNVNLAKLPTPQKERVLSDYRELKQLIRQHFRKGHQKRQELLTLLAQPTLDELSFNTQKEDLLSWNEQSERDIISLIKKDVTAMNDEEKMALISLLKRPLKKEKTPHDNKSAQKERKLAK